jgi:hypothetical protein
MTTHRGRGSDKYFPRTIGIAAENGMTLLDFPTPEACRRSRGEFVVIVRDPEHYLLGCFVIHLLGQDTGVLGSQLPMFWIVEMRDIAHGGGPFLGPTL